MKLIKSIAAAIVLFLGGCAVQGGREDQAIELQLSPDRTLLKLFNRTSVILHTDDLFVRYATVGASQLRLVAFDNLGRNVPVCGPIVFEHPPKLIDVTPNSEIILDRKSVV